MARQLLRISRLLIDDVSVLYAGAHLEVPKPDRRQYPDCFATLAWLSSF